MEALLTKTLMARNKPIINEEKLDKDKRWRYRSFNETNSRKERQNKLKHLDYSIDSLSLETYDFNVLFVLLTNWKNC